MKSDLEIEPAPELGTAVKWPNGIIDVWTDTLDVKLMAIREECLERSRRNGAEVYRVEIRRI